MVVLVWSGVEGRVPLAPPSMGVWALLQRFRRTAFSTSDSSRALYWTPADGGCTKRRLMLARETETCLCAAESRAKAGRLG